MKKMKMIGLIFFVSIFCLSLNGKNIKAAVGDTIAETFPDPNMAQAVAAYLSEDTQTQINVNDILTSTMANNCTRLDIQDLEISNLQGIKVFTNLKNLQVSSNELTTLPDEIGSLTKLTSIDAGNNQITSLPTSMANLTNLNTIFLDYNKLSSFPLILLNNKKLSYLILDSNEIPSLPDTIEQLTKLEFFDISGNNLTKIPDSLGNLPALVYLDFGSNQITEVPATIGNIDSLEYLSMDNNGIETLPDALFHLENLVLFRIDDNKIINLPSYQYDFITNMSNFYALNGQKNAQTITTLGTIDEEYVFEAYPAQEQFVDYGITFKFMLVKPDKSEVELTNPLAAGKITIPAAYLDQKGSYTLVTKGRGGDLTPVEYQQTFTIADKPVIESKPDKPGITTLPGKTETPDTAKKLVTPHIMKSKITNETLSKTGHNFLPLVTLFTIVGGLALYWEKRGHE